MDAFLSIFSSLPTPVREKLDSLFSSIHFTRSEKLEIVKEEADLLEWKEESFVLSHPFTSKGKDGRDGERYISELRRHMKRLRESETDYSNFFPQKRSQGKTKKLMSD